MWFKGGGLLFVSFFFFFWREEARRGTSKINACSFVSSTFFLFLSIFFPFSTNFFAPSILAVACHPLWNESIFVIVKRTRGYNGGRIDGKSFLKYNYSICKWDARLWLKDRVLELPRIELQIFSSNNSRTPPLPSAIRVILTFHHHAAVIPRAYKAPATIPRDKPSLRVCCGPLVLNRKT